MAKKKDEAPTIGDLLREVSEVDGGTTADDGAIEVEDRPVTRMDAFKERIFLRVLEAHLQAHLERRSGDNIERILDSMLNDSEYIAERVADRAFAFLTKPKDPEPQKVEEKKVEEKKAPVVISSL